MKRFGNVLSKVFLGPSALLVVWLCISKFPHHEFYYHFNGLFKCSIKTVAAGDLVFKRCCGVLTAVS